MPEFVIFGIPTGGFLPSAKAAGAIDGNYTSYTMKPLQRQLLRIHMSDKINRVISLPFKRIWIKLYMNHVPVSEDNDIYFILCESFNLAYSADCLKYIRGKYRNAKLIFYFRNPLAGPHMSLVKKWDKLRHLYDAGITFNKSDADKYGLLYTDYWPCLLPEKHYQPENASDVFFIGQAKDRLPQILAIYERLTEAGLKCDFWVTGAPEDERRIFGGMNIGDFSIFADFIIRNVHRKDS